MKTNETVAPTCLSTRNGSMIHKILQSFVSITNFMIFQFFLGYSFHFSPEEVLKFCTDCKLIISRFQASSPQAVHLCSPLSCCSFIAANIYVYGSIGVLSEGEEPCEIPDGFYDNFMP